MKYASKFIIWIVLCALLAVSTAGCERPGEPSAGAGAGAATLDLNATVNAAVAATRAAQPSNTPDLNATVNAAVQATTQAQKLQQITISSAVAATVAAMPTATPVPVAELSEEELTNLIEKEVAEANAATQQANTATTQATSDGTLTPEEEMLLEYYYYTANLAVNEAIALADSYMSIYAELAEETIVLLNAVEQDLSAMSQTISSMATNLAEINQTMQQGQQAAQDAIKKLQQQAQEASDKAKDVKDKAGQWAKDNKAGLDKRPDKFLNLKPQPDQIFSDRKDVINQVRDYVDLVSNSLLDGKIGRDEMNHIAQLGNNATESIKRFNKPELDRFGDSIQGINRNLSRGEVPQARNRSRDVDRSFPKRGR